MLKRLICSAITTLILFGCSGTHNFFVQFNDIQGLKEGDQILFDETPIGTVADVEYTDKGNFLVSLAVDKNFAGLPKDSSMFFIDSAPVAAGPKAVRIIQIEDGGNKIEKNAIVQGQSKYAAVYGQIAGKFRNNVRLLESEINEFFEKLKNISIDEQIKQIEIQLDRILAEMEDASAEMKYRLEKEILPRMREKIEELRRQLEQLGKEKKLKYVDQKIEVISAKL